MCDLGLSKKCLVCGDKAIGNNFDALSCESCKAFFRRNAIKNKEFKCHFENKCRIDVKTRRFCKKCRLKKCIEIGMKKDWILSDEEKKVRKNKIESNRIKRKNSDFNTSTDSNSSSSPDNSCSDSNTATQIPDTFGDFNIDLDYIIPNNFEIQPLVKKFNQISDSVYQKAVELEFSVIPIARPINDYRNTFNELESNKLTELLNATSIMKNSSNLFTSKARNILDVCRVMGLSCEQEIRKIIKMSKKLTAFNTVCESDKLVLIKYSSLGLFCMRSIQNFDCDNQCLTLSMENGHSFIIKMEMMRELPRNFHLLYLNFLQKINREWDSDPVILDLLTSVALFNPDTPHIICRELVKLQQQIYMYLLQRYLMVKYKSESESKLKFLRLLDILIDLTFLDRIYSKNCFEKEPEYVPLLLKEISSK